MALLTYDPLAVVAIYQGVNITGYQDGTFIEVERSSDSFTKHVGSTGQVARVQSRDQSGKITITLMHVSPTNDLLAALLALDELSNTVSAGLPNGPGTNFGSFQVKDLHGNMKCQAHEAWIMKQPKVERAEKLSSVVWVFECSQISMFAGGNVF